MPEIIIIDDPLSAAADDKPKDTVTVNMDDIWEFMDNPYLAARKLIGQRMILGQPPYLHEQAEPGNSD